MNGSSAPTKETQRGPCPPSCKDTAEGSTCEPGSGSSDSRSVEASTLDLPVSDHGSLWFVGHPVRGVVRQPEPRRTHTAGKRDPTSELLGSDKPRGHLGHLNSPKRWRAPGGSPRHPHSCRVLSAASPGPRSFETLTSPVRTGERGSPFHGRGAQAQKGRATRPRRPGSQRGNAAPPSPPTTGHRSVAAAGTGSGFKSQFCPSQPWGLGQPRLQKHSPSRPPSPGAPPLGTDLHAATAASWHKLEAGGPSPMSITTRPGSAGPTPRSLTPDPPPPRPQPPREPAQGLLAEGSQTPRPPRRTPRARLPCQTGKRQDATTHSRLWGPPCRCLCRLLCGCSHRPPDAGSSREGRAEPGTVPLTLRGPAAGGEAPGAGAMEGGLTRAGVGGPAGVWRQRSPTMTSLHPLSGWGAETQPACWPSGRRSCHG